MMKNLLVKIAQREFSKRAYLITFLIFCLVAPVIAQEEEAKEEKPARPAFESAWWFDRPTGLLYDQKTLEFIIQHRFGVINNGLHDLFGVYGPTNVRLGLAYAPIDKLNVGLGYTKNKHILDLNAKYGILTQTRSNSMPVSLGFYTNMGVELLDEVNYEKSSHRYNYYHSLIISRRMNSKLSIQVSPSFSHYNAVYAVEQSDGSFGKMENDTWTVSTDFRYKLTSTLIFMFGYDHQITQHAINQPEPAFNFGIEISTSNHAFQIFASNNGGIQPQENFTFNTNQWKYSEYLIGFNITKLWSF
ncbi:MAG: hypothetical protein JXQ96_14040 [Cyclobacteriaceae bacterium]